MVSRLEKNVRFMEEREKQHSEDKKLWESLITQSRDYSEQLESEIAKTRQKEQELETQVFEIDKQAKEWQAQVEKTNAEVVAAKLDEEQNARELRTQLDKCQGKRRETVQAHAKTIRELNSCKENLLLILSTGRDPA